MLRRHNGACITGAAFAPEMIKVGRSRPGGEQTDWIEADAMDLPFVDGTFDAATHGYLLRHVADIPTTLAKKFRVLKPGGRIMSLETSPAPDNIIQPFSTAYIKYVVPQVCRLPTRDPDAYEHLSATSRGLKTPAQIQELLEGAGFTDIGQETHVFGTLAIHWATKPR